jgi:hypothetical protein
MKNIMKKAIDKLVVKRHYLIVEGRDVLETLGVVNEHRVFYINQKLAVGECGWAQYPTKWFIHFDASDDQWASIIGHLHNKGFELVIKERPKDIFVIRKRLGP